VSGLGEVSVIVTTYRRAWALPNLFSALARQTLLPGEVIVVLKPSGDSSERIVEEWSRKLPIKLVIQRRGNVAEAAEIGLRSSSYSYVLFVDDDAIPREDWVEKYVKLFERLPDAGGIGGLIYKAFLRDGRIELEDEGSYLEVPTAGWLHRKPLPEFERYCGWISVSGLPGARACTDRIAPSTNLSGVNMGFRREAIAGCSISVLYRGSRKCLHYESVLCYCARVKGFKTYSVKDPSIAPVVYHLVGVESLTRGRGFAHEFWLHYDRAMDYWRLKKLGAKVSFTSYLLAMAVLLRRKTVPRALAFLYAITSHYLKNSPGTSKLVSKPLA